MSASEWSCIERGGKLDDGTVDGSCCEDSGGSDCVSDEDWFVAFVNNVIDSLQCNLDTARTACPAGATTQIDCHDSGCCWVEDGYGVGTCIQRGHRELKEELVSGGVDDGKRAVEELKSHRRSLGEIACPNRGNRICHPAHSTVELASGAHVRLDAVAVGDIIRTPSGLEPIVGFLHADAHVVSPYHVFVTEANQSITISHKHFLMVDGIETDPDAVVLGQMLSTPTGPQAITSIGKETHVGAFHPVTASGAYYVDGIAASTYVSYIPHVAWKIFGDGYIALRYQLGLPVVPEGAAPVSLFWMLDALQAVGVPDAMQSAVFWPLIAGSVMLTELASAVAAKLAPISSGVLTTAGLIVAPLLVANTASK